MKIFLTLLGLFLMSHGNCQVLDSTLRWEYDLAKRKFSLLSKDINVYNGKGQLVLIEQYGRQLNEQKWQLSYKESRTYSDDRSIVEATLFSPSLNKSEWIASQKDHYSYNEHGQVIAFKKSRFTALPNVWTYTSCDSFYYGQDEKIKTHYRYDEEQNLVPLERTRRKLDESGHLVSITLEMFIRSENEWRARERTAYTYGEMNELLTETSYYIDLSETRQRDSIEHVYRNGQLMRTTTYRENQPIAHYEYSYSSLGQLTTSEFYNWNRVHERFDHNETYEYTYNDSSKLISQIHTKWKGFVTSFKQDYSYNGHDSLWQFDRAYLSIETWRPMYRLRYYYSRSRSATLTKEGKVYPNPVRSTLYFPDMEATGMELIITNSSGQIMLRESLTGNSYLSVAHLAKDVYTYQLLGGPEVIVGKFIKI